MAKRDESIVLESPEGEKLLARLRHDPPVLFLGSAISAFAPSCLPAGGGFAKELFEFLFPPAFFDSKAEASICRQLFDRVPFEHVMEACPRQDIAERIVRETLTCETPNPLHHCAADALLHGFVRAIVTPNYDRCLEAVPGFLGTARRIVTSDEALGDVDHDRVYFKIHGSLEPSAPRYDASVVFALRHEAILPDWKRDVLRRIVKDRILLVAGYSGSDFEICPELQRAGAAEIWWLFMNARELHLRNNARHLLSIVDGTVLVGDIRALLGQLSRLPSKVEAAFDPRFDRLLASLHASCGESDRLDWRARLSVGMGCASLASRAAAERAALDASWSRSVSGARTFGNAAFHSGQYRWAFRRFREAARNDTESFAARCGMKLEMAEALRCYGARWRALTTILLARRQIRRRLDAGLERTRLDGAAALRIALLARGWFQLAGRLRLARVQAHMRPWLAAQLRTAADAALAAGDRINLHHIQLTADRVGITFGDLVSNDSLGVPTKEGYQNLGYLIAESMAFRDVVRRQSAFTPEDMRALRRYLRRHRVMNNWPEVWKLSIVKTMKGPRSARRHGLRRTLSAFARCQYTPLFRITTILWPS